MIFRKAPHPANFSFAEGFDPGSGALRFGARTPAAEIRARLEIHADGVARFTAEGHPEWIGGNLLELNAPPGEPTLPVAIQANGVVTIGLEGAPPLDGRFGVSGPASCLVLDLPEGTRYFGMGEKTFGQQELSGFRARFWNTDVWSDFAAEQWGGAPTDPSYFTTPYVACRVPTPGGGATWLGVLLHNPWPSFIETPGFDDSRVFVSWQRTYPALVIGSDGGTPDFWFVRAASLAELTRRLQRLVGVTPRPARWALGYHQSRWGYGGHEDLLALDREFARHEIPCDGLWLDLDYMDGYRIFTVNESLFPDGVAATADALAQNGRRMVPILDPGIKREPGFELHDDAEAKGHLCLNPEGRPFVGLVWPGETVFPDFSREETRDWWAARARTFLARGFGGAWVDMNDPSTGPVDPDAMRFDEGRLPHAAHRNDYALGMQMATVAGFERERPDERPFLLSRSGFVGSSRFGAIWTGDNLSNRFYLRSSIPTGIGLSLSGLPFHGMDVGGFGGDCDAGLMEDWIKLAFLFPFFRNHANNDSRRQEPFAYPKGTMEVVRRYIRLRYKLMPHLESLWAAHEETGDPVLRPVLYHFDEPGAERLDREFLVGETILQAPFTDEERQRGVTLPGSRRWCEADTGLWREPGTATVRRRRFGTPLYFAEGALIAMRPGTPRDPRFDAREQNLHLFAPENWTGEAETILLADDGISHAYRTGGRSRLRVRVVGADGNLAVKTEPLEEGFGPISARLVIHGAPKSVRVGGTAVEPERERTTLTDRALPVGTFALS